MITIDGLYATLRQNVAVLGENHHGGEASWGNSHGFAGVQAVQARTSRNTIMDTTPLARRVEFVPPG